MPNHYLIPYVPLKGHKDPDLKQLAYGESGRRGKILKKNLSNGSYLFFHTKIGSSKYITGYIVVERILSGKEARLDPLIYCDGRSDDWLFIGNKEQSKRLRKPMCLNRNLAQKLSLNIDFEPFLRGKKTELEVIGSATRAHRQLSDADVRTLLTEIQKYEENTKNQNPQDVKYHLHFYDECEDVIPIDEVHKLREIEIQRLLRKNPNVLDKGATIIDYEKPMPDGDRLDLLLRAKDGALIVAELKGPNKLTDDIPTQVASYARDIQKLYPKHRVRKMIVCDGKLSPKLSKACESLGIEVIVYGVRLDCFKLQ
jgi:hypothetical protein